MNTRIGKPADAAKNIIDSNDEKFIANPPHKSYYRVRNCFFSCKIYALILTVLTLSRGLTTNPK